MAAWIEKYSGVGSVLALVFLAVGVILARRDLLGGEAANVYADVSETGPNALGESLLTENYYQQLLGERRSDLDTERWAARVVAQIDPWVPIALGVKPPANENWGPLAATEAAFHSDNYLGHELLPNADVEHKGVRIKTNRHGHRDDDIYEKTKPPGTFRIALVGGSNTMGTGVDHGDTFEARLEDRLNQELTGKGYDRYEVINFSVAGYFLDSRIYVVDNKVGEFDPDLVLVSATMHDVRQLHDYLAKRVEEGRDLHYEFLDAIIAEAGIGPRDGMPTKSRKLRMLREQLLGGCFEELARYSRDSGVPVAVAVLRLKANARIQPDLYDLAEQAEEHRLTALEVFNAYEGQSPDDMYLRKDVDLHPNRKAHQLLGDDLYDQMTTDPRIKKLLMPASDPRREETHERQSGD